jgi:hypothetical protein
MLHRIRKIVNTAPYTIVCEWTNGEVRAIQMEEKIKEWADSPGSVYKKLLNQEIFMDVRLDTESKTLFWEGLITMKSVSGEILNAPLDIDPETLYEMSEPVNIQTLPENKAA